MECVFCQIAQGKIPVDIVYYNDRSVAFRARDAEAPVHLIVAPKQHTLMGDFAVVEMPSMIDLVNTIVASLKLTSGYRLVINQGVDAGQTVEHLHMHLLAGRSLGDICTEFRS